MISSERAGSRLPVGSSAMMVLGLLMSARAMALLFAAGELVGITVGLFLKSDELKHIGDALFDLARRRTDGAHGEAQVLVDRFLLDQAEVLEDDADGAAQQRDLPLGNVRGQSLYFRLNFI